MWLTAEADGNIIESGRLAGLRKGRGVGSWHPWKDYILALAAASTLILWQPNAKGQAGDGRVDEQADHFVAQQLRYDPSISYRTGIPSNAQISFLLLILFSALSPVFASSGVNSREEPPQVTRASTAPQIIVVQERLNQVVIFRKDRPQDRTVIQVGEKPHEVEVTGDGETAYVSNFGLLEADHKVGVPGSTISVIDVKRKRERLRFVLPDGARAPHGLKIRPGYSNELFTNTEEGLEEMVVIDATSGAILRTFHCQAEYTTSSSPLMAVIAMHSRQQTASCG